MKVIIKKKKLKTLKQELRQQNKLINEQHQKIELFIKCLHKQKAKDIVMRTSYTVCCMCKNYQAYDLDCSRVMSGNCFCVFLDNNKPINEQDPIIKCNFEFHNWDVPGVHTPKFT